MQERGTTDRDDGVALAWVRTAGRGPMTVFLPGYRSDMTGAKAIATEAFCAAHGLACLRLDYSGHGASGGAFVDGTIGRWTDDALLLIDRLTEGLIVLVGSSMGGWIALLAALARPDRVAGLVGIAAAPDFTEDLMLAAMMPAERAQMDRDGVLLVPSQYGDPTPVTAGLIADGRTRLLLRAPIPLTCPVRLLHGQRDPDVPWETSLRLADRLQSDDVVVTLIKDGDHRLSRPADLLALRRTLGTLLLQDGA
ncbi:MAG: alpha/beta hydrolase [Gemmatimonadaceae bacterium]|nr:alpha/beta hydrolase [Acetobacteraceae bacterium]